MRKPNNCSHAFQEVKRRGKIVHQSCMDCKKLLYKWQKELKTANQPE